MSSPVAKPTPYPLLFSLALYALAMACVEAVLVVFLRTLCAAR